MTSTEHSPRTIQFAVRGMTCASCASTVERAIAALPGVRRVVVNLATETATIDPSDGLDPAAVARAVSDAGYRAVSRATSADPSDVSREEAKQRRRLWFAIAASAPLVAVAMLRLAFVGSGFVEWALATVVVFVAGAQFFVIAA